MADEKLRSYRRHSEKPWELEPELSEHRSAMTTEALHSKAEIAEEFAVRDRKISALEARAEKAEREHEDTIPAHIHEDLRQVMLSERRRAEKAEWERDLLQSQMAARDKQDGETSVAVAIEVDAVMRKMTAERDAALARVRELEAKLSESESNTAWLDRAQKLSEQLDAITTGADKSDADEHAAFRWLMGWLKEKFRDGEEYSLAACDSGIGIFFTGNILVVKESTPVALATALDPNWRKAGSKAGSKEG